MIDSKLLPPGELDFNSLNQVYIIIIASFDLFVLDKYMYTFKMRCEEAPGVTLDDGAIRIFLNTNGKRPEEVNAELVELLRYMENTSEETTRECKSERIRQMQASEERSPPSSKDALCMIFA